MIEHEPIRASTIQHDTYKPPFSNVQKPRPFCNYCMKPGHYMEFYYQLHGFPEVQALEKFL